MPLAVNASFREELMIGAGLLDIVALAHQVHTHTHTHIHPLMQHLAGSSIELLTMEPNVDACQK